jgi:putative membrane protein
MAFKNPYAQFEKSELILRDELAIDRTLLANERTLLAYLRSGVALLIAGGSIVNFSQHVWFLSIGLACLPAGAVAILLGVWRYRRMHMAISHVRRKSGETITKQTTSVN